MRIIPEVGIRWCIYYVLFASHAHGLEAHSAGLHYTCYWIITRVRSDPTKGLEREREIERCGRVRGRSLRARNEDVEGNTKTYFRAWKVESGFPDRRFFVPWSSFLRFCAPFNPTDSSYLACWINYVNGQSGIALFAVRWKSERGIVVSCGGFR